MIGLVLFSCSKDDDGPNIGGDSENSSKVVINANGTTSTNAKFTPIDNSSFYLDYVKYEIVDSHLEIVGYDEMELSGIVRPYATVVYRGMEYNTRVIGNSAFYGNGAITECIIPPTVVTIGWWAFKYCSGLTNLVIPDAVASIGGGAFEDCSSLTNLIIPNSVGAIKAETFKGCSGLSNLTIPNSVVTIGDNAFENCSGLTSLTIPNSVTEIGEEAFLMCSNLRTIVIPNSVVELGREAFQHCWELLSLTLSDNLKYFDIFNMGLSTCSELYEINIDSHDYYSIDGVVYSPDGSKLILCPRGLKSYRIPDFVSIIGARAFAGCAKLPYIAIPKTVTTIEYGAFAGTKIKDFRLPKTVTSLGNYIFENCYDLENIWTDCTAGGASELGIGRGHSYSLKAIHVPANMIDLYQNSYPWRDYEDLLVGDYVPVD